MLYQTHMRVNLGHIRTNLEALRERIGPGTRLLLTVKCNAYGLGVPRIATLAEREGLADWLGVATVPEGIEARAAGVRLPILKLSHAFPEEMDAALDHGLTLAVCQRENVLALQARCAARGMRANVHLKVETGLGRIGVDPAQAPDLARFIERDCPNLHLEGLFTHMAASGTPQGDAYTEVQMGRFEDATWRIAEAIGRLPELVHCANTGQVMRRPPEPWCTMVRVGQAAFGTYSNLVPAPGCPPFLKGLDSVRTRVAFVKRVGKGTPIGYGLAWTAPEATWIATIPVGWADGYSRRLSHAGKVLVGGRACPVVGTLCMDQTMVDLGPETDVQVGDEVVLVGRSGNLEITAEDLAGWLGTVPYELICQFSLRVQRVYDW